MDVVTSRKITRYQPSGSVLVLMDNITDIYPVFNDAGEITDIEMLDNERDELLDRAMWAVLKQRGGDPLDPLDGNQHEECVLGEISPVALIGQITASVAAEGPGVRSSFSTSTLDGKEYLSVAVTLTPQA